MIKTLKRAFSLAEAMIAITVITLVLAITTPILVKTQSGPAETPWKFVTLGDLWQKTTSDISPTSIYTVTSGSATAVFGDKRVPIDTNVTHSDKKKVFASKINPKISIVARNHANNPLISRHLIDFYEKTATEGQYNNIGKISFDKFYNLAVGKNALDSAEQSTTASIVKFDDAATETLWTELKGENDTNLKSALNTAVGQYAMGGDKKNLAFSTESPTRNMSGAANTAVGAFAMRRNTIGDFNTAIGAYALESATDTNPGKGSNNVAVGYTALRTNNSDSGEKNTAVGERALKSNTTGRDNTAAGAESLNSNTTGGYNTAAGYRSLYSNTTGSENTAVGTQSLNLNTTGGYNTAAGYQALQKNTTGSKNTAIGYLALHGPEADGSYMTGTENTAVGYQALSANTIGNYNTAVGYQALSANTTGSYNTAIGYQALPNYTANYNTAVGYQALKSNMTGGHNTAIGCKAAENINSSNKLYISANQAYTGSNSLIYGDDSNDSSTKKIVFNVTNKQAYLGFASDDDKIATRGDINPYISSEDSDICKIAYSDSRLKDITGDNTSGLKEILRIKVKNFTMKNDKNNEIMVGVIAQELQKVFPNSVFEGADGYLKIKRDEIFYACVNAIKELYETVQDIAAKVSGLDKKIAALEEQAKNNEETLTLLETQNKIYEQRLSALKQ